MTGPDLIEQVLVTMQNAFTIGRAQRETFSEVENDAVTASTGEHWAQLRSALHSAFTWDGIQQYDTQISQRTIDHVEGWNDGEELEELTEMR